MTPTTATYDGTAKAISVLLSPAGVANQITYVNSSNHSVATPTAAGVYTAAIVITDTTYDSQPTTTGTLTVSPAALTVTAANASRFVGAANPSFTGTVTGAVSADGISATYATSAVVSSPPGSYNIVPTLVDPNTKLGNYTVTQNNGTLTITKATSSLSLTTNPTAPAFGQTVTLTATISPNAVTGTVTFLDGSTVLGTANVVNWVATLPVNSLSVGAHNLSATYSGDSSYLASPAGSVAVTVAKGSGNPVVAATPSQPGFGQPVTITATLSGSPTGSVILTDGSTQVGTATLTNGVATFTLSNLS